MTTDETREPHDSTAPGALRRLLPPARRFLASRKRALAALAGWSLVESAQTFLGGYCIAQALDRGFLAGDTKAGLLWLSAAAVSILVAAPVVLGVFAQLARLVEPLRDALVTRAVSRSLRRAVAAPGRADGTAVSRLTQQTEIARDSFAGLVLTLRSFAFTAAGALAGLFTLAPEFLLVVLPPLVLGLALFAATLRPMAAAQNRFLDADEAITHHSGAVRAALRDIVACGTQNEAERRGAQLITDAEQASRSLARWAAVRTLALGVGGQLPVVLLLVATPWLLSRNVTAGALIGALTYLVQALLPALHTLMTALGAAGTRLVVVLDRFVRDTCEIPSSVRPVDTRVQPSGSSTAVEVRSVRLAYGPRARPVLDGLDLSVRTGEHIAVVGPSGIGKSTLAGVVAGMLTPDRGTVHLAGRPVTGRPVEELAPLRVLTPQEAYVFTGTVRENLTTLRPGAPAEDIEAAAEALCLGPLIRRLGGIDAGVTPSALSQGERQLLSLGRAYLSPAPLLLLDEATCHLDPAAEARAERALARRPGTLIVVAHRLSSALRADRVLVLDGTCAEFGSHAELLTRSELYRDLVGHWQEDR
ncbi:ATP-binding cassette domain-containing protein [Streptomyces sp. NPDC058685]|uniref:ATP-binding cassette domain-containing protein n=1 Tax=Streptomyces sp. NPDC058685 TaxID=3346598 RepID=UPI003661C5D7